MKDWDIFVPSVQLAMNAKVAKRHDTALYTLMFARKMNNFEDYTKDGQLSPLSQKELKERIISMEKTVFPAISERVQAVMKRNESPTRKI